MKTLFAVLFVLSASAAFAGSISKSCSNAGATILIDDSVVTVIVKKSWPGVWEEKIEKFNKSNIKIDVTERFNVREESRSHSASTYSMEVIQFSKINEEEKMPDAYSKRANEDGTLSDVFVCKLTRSWM